MSKWPKFVLMILLVLAAAGCVSADRIEMRVPKGYFDTPHQGDKP